MMKFDNITHIQFDKKLLIIGFGCIGQSVLPLIFRHIKIKPEQLSIITKKDDGAQLAKEYGVDFQIMPINRDNYQDIVTSRLKEGDFLLNLSVDVSSVDLITLCQEKGIIYLDSCIEPWEGGYVDKTLSPSMRSNYAMREQALALKKPGTHPTAVLTHGANPGMVSHFVKQALVNIANDTNHAFTQPTTQAEWASLAQALNIKVIHIAERDNQVANKPKRPDEFVNTWSIDGFVSEGSQPAELGWGSHERHFPHDGSEHEFGCKAAIYLNRPGASTRVRSWAPNAGPFHGFLITHNEAISIADFFTVKNGDKVEYRPTVHYAYHPCEDAILSLHELAGNEWKQQKTQRLMESEIIDGIDELGVLLMGNPKGAYWYGSQLSIQEARELAPNNSATSLQVSVCVLAGIIWAMKNPQAGIVEPDQMMDYEYTINIAKPYLGKLGGHYTNWTPIQRRESLFPEGLDTSDPWQFVNIRVN